MSPRFARLRPDMTVTEAIVYLRRQARSREQRLETLNYAYVLDADQRLLVFAFMSNGALPLRTRPKLDDLAAELSRCGCR